jgi:hypothetical protein
VVGAAVGIVESRRQVDAIRPIVRIGGAKSKEEKGKGQRRRKIERRRDARDFSAMLAGVEGGETAVRWGDKLAKAGKMIALTCLWGKRQETRREERQDKATAWAARSGPKESQRPFFPFAIRVSARCSAFGPETTDGK